MANFSPAPDPVRHWCRLLLLLLAVPRYHHAFYTPGGQQQQSLPQHCLPGEYLQPFVGRFQCEKCPPGKYSPIPPVKLQVYGEPMPRACLPCTPGTYQWQIGASSCLA